MLQPNNRDNGVDNDVVEAFGGAPPALIFPRRRRMPGREVPQQRPRTAVQPASFEGTVQVLAMVEIAVHASHQAVEHVAGAVTAGVAVRDRPSVASCHAVRRLPAQEIPFFNTRRADIPLAPEGDDPLSAFLWVKPNRSGSS